MYIGMKTAHFFLDGHGFVSHTLKTKIKLVKTIKFRIDGSGSTWDDSGLSFNLHQTLICES